MATLSERFDAAVRYAREVHAGQTRKGTDAPYLAHLLGVSSIVLDDGGSEEEAIAAFKQGYQIEPDPQFLYALGQAQRMSGDCAHAVEACAATVPPLDAAGPGHRVACIRAHEIA